MHDHHAAYHQLAEQSLFFELRPAHPIECRADFVIQPADEPAAHQRLRTALDLPTPHVLLERLVRFARQRPQPIAFENYELVRIYLHSRERPAADKTVPTERLLRRVDRLEDIALALADQFQVDRHRRFDIERQLLLDRNHALALRAVDIFLQCRDHHCFLMRLIALINARTDALMISVSMPAPKCFLPAASVKPIYAIARAS